MATPDVSNATQSQTRSAKPAPRPMANRKTPKPSIMPVVGLSVLYGLGIHLLFSLGLGGLGDEVKWHPFAVDAQIRFGEAQFGVSAILALLPFDILFGFVLATVTGFIIRVPFFRDRVHHTVIDLKKRLMLQLSASAEEVESIIKNDPENNARLLARREDINLDSVQAEIGAINSSLAYLGGKGSWLGGFSSYMRFHFTEEHSNVVTGMAYGGAAFLIIVVGIRGLKFIPPTKPSFILFALGVEFTMLVLLAAVMLFTMEEERTDRILKQMVDAVKGGKKQGGGMAEPEAEPALQLSRADYERIVREQMDKKIVQVMSDKDDDALRRIALDLVSKG